MTIKNVADVARYLTDEKAAEALIQSMRWPNGVRCPFCDHGVVYDVKGGYRDGRQQWKCAACREKFSVTSRSIFEGSHIALGKWIYAIFLMCSSKKGVSANQLKRELGVTYRTAWFMCHRVRTAMAQEPLSTMLGTSGGIVELDETYVGGKFKNNMHKRKPGARRRKKVVVMTLIDRDRGQARAIKVQNASKPTLQSVARPIVDRSATIVTDKWQGYAGIAKHFAGHETVDHGKEYVRGIIHTNFAESYHSLLKRGIIGTFHNVSAKHMDAYLSEFDWRWNSRKVSDGERTLKTLRAAPGKRLYLKIPKAREAIQ